jgi:hypothetical protein
MYIIAKKKDYYDGVAGTTGIDKTIVYDRQIVEIENGKLPKLLREYSPWNNKNPSPFIKLGNTSVKKELRVVYLHVSPFIIGFCGKLYVGWKLYSEIKTNSYPFKDMLTTITYDNENMKTIVDPHHWGSNFEDDLNYVLSYNPISLFRGFNAPVFIYDHDYGRTSIDKYWRNHPKFFINPLLKEYQFYKVFDAVQAFQEIQMFMGGVLGAGEKEIVEVEDKYKITQHGFNKWSFRKEPQKKKL